MKSPAFLAARLHKQWQDTAWREERLLYPKAWPIALTIGKPTASEFTAQGRLVREHVERWRAVRIGEVVYEDISYRAGGEAVRVPITWSLRNAAEWATATADSVVEAEHATLKTVLAQSDALFHRTLIRQLRWVMRAGEEAALRAVRLAETLAPGCAEGRPLRALAAGVIDSKFIERHRTLVQMLLDARFEGQASEQGLESFLGALDEGDHWLLIAPLQQDLLPFARQTVAATEIMTKGLPGTHILVIENERSLYQLPALPDTVAVLGSGLNLAWMVAPWLQSKAIGYWGDLDTWGLVMLATARIHQPKLDALLMDLPTFEVHAALAVPEPHPASDLPPNALSEPEKALYWRLRQAERGRLEQEFLPGETVAAQLTTWRFKTGV